MGGTDLAFGADRYQLTFDQDALRLLITGGRASGDVNLPLRAVVTGREVLASVQQAILVERPTIVSVAQDLTMSVRMLQRELEYWGVTFEQVLDEYRQIHAFEELTEGDHSVTETALELGYADSAHFTRAVRRCTGKPPRQIRRERMAGFIWSSAPSNREHGRIGGS